MHLSGADDARSGPELAIAIRLDAVVSREAHEGPLRTTTERADWLPDRFRIALTERASARSSRGRSQLVPSGQVIGCEAGYRSAR
jgi:hypothetical protein